MRMLLYFMLRYVDVHDGSFQTHFLSSGIKFIYSQSKYSKSFYLEMIFKLTFVFCTFISIYVTGEDCMLRSKITRNFIFLKQ